MKTILFALAAASAAAAPLAAQMSVNQQAVPPQLTLENAIGIALRNNAAYLRLGNDSALSVAARKNAFSRMLPIPSGQISTNAGPSRASSPAGTSSSSSSGTSLGLGFSLNIFDGGRSLNTYRQSKMNIQTSTLNLTTQEITLRINVINQYYQTQQAERSLALERRLLAQREVELKETENKFLAVLINFVDMERAKASVAQYRNTVLNAEDNLTKAKLSLLGAIGITANTDFSLVTPLPVFADSVRMNADSIVQLALERNPSIRQQQLSLDQQRMNNRITRNSRFMPNVRLSGNFSRGISESGYSALLDPTGRTSNLNSSFSLGFSFSQLLDFTNTSFTLKQSGAGLEDAIISTRDLNTSIERQVRTAVINIRQAYRALTFANDQVRLAQIQLQAASDMLEANTISYFNYQTIIDDAATAERNVLTQQLNILSQQLILDQLLGNRPGGG